MEYPKLFKFKDHISYHPRDAIRSQRPWNGFGYVWRLLYHDSLKKRLDAHNHSNSLLDLSLYSKIPNDLSLKVNTPRFLAPGFPPKHSGQRGVGNQMFTLPTTSSSPLKMVVSNRNLLFQWSIFRGYVSSGRVANPIREALISNAQMFLRPEL